MNTKVKKAGVGLLHYLAAAFVFWLHAFFISPALWKHGSSSAFEINLAIWVVVIVWIGYLIMPALIVMRRTYRKLRGI